MTAEKAKLFILTVAFVICTQFHQIYNQQKTTALNFRSLGGGGGNPLSGSGQGGPRLAVIDKKTMEKTWKYMDKVSLI